MVFISIKQLLAKAWRISITLGMIIFNNNEGIIMRTSKTKLREKKGIA